jgi:uncharacterized protein YceH (UPF0502 family)
LIETDQLLDDLDNAKDRIRLARDHLNGIPRDSKQYQGALLSYLHAVVSHMSIVSVAQAKQHQDLSEEVDRLEGEVKALRTRLDAFARPRLV